MEERNLEFDDDGKIKIRKTGDVLPGESAENADDIIIEIPDFDGF